MSTVGIFQSMNCLCLAKIAVQPLSMMALITGRRPLKGSVVLITENQI